MTEITLYNTANRRKETLRPIDPKNVRMYVCGPTVYDRAHLGNARPAVVFDVLFRLLRHVYGEDHVVYVRNITDIDDKINARAAKSGRPIREITDETAQWYIDDMAALGNLEPSHMPRATDWIAPMVAMIEDLVAKGHAYEAEGHVLFRVRSYADYGKLSRRSVDDMIAGARVEVAPFKEDPMDFVLWKPSTDDLPGWESPWGRGRPGWHIECSAMSYELLGPEFDIHAGGNDLTFPHHENEIAQSRCMGHAFARVWMHNEMLQVEGKKMSKSLGNFFSVRDLLDQGVPGEVIRFVFLSSHYRKPMDWTEEKANASRVELTKWRTATDGIESGDIDADVVNAIAEDLNTHGAITVLRELFNTGRFEALKSSAEMLGLLTPELSNWEWKIQTIKGSLFQNVNTFGANIIWQSNDPKILIEQLLRERQEARENKNFARADELRDGFAAAGIIVNDTPRGVEWEIGPHFDQAKLEALK